MTDKLRGIYAITHIPTGRRYIGSTEDWLGDEKKRHGRRRAHLCMLRAGNHPNPKLQRAWKKYGEEEFSFELIEECTINVLLEREQVYIDDLDEKDFNIAKLAGRPPNMRGRPCSEVTRLKISESRKGIPLSEYHCKRLSEAWETRLPVSEETRRKLSEASTGRIPSEETRIKLRESNKESNLGRIHSEEERQKISKANKGHKVSEETRRKISAKNKGRVRTEESRQKMSEAAKRRGVSRLNIPISCPHCGKIGTIGGMKRWHFDNCKHGDMHG